uniref:Uncharacterized protein n=1 Tax=Anguilla anguilla TaxID=7936 RepID=A0A0E9PK86_ANGAN
MKWTFDAVFFCSAPQCSSRLGLQYDAIVNHIVMFIYHEI